MSALTEQLVKLLSEDDGKNYDPRMEELMRSDRLIDPKAENLSKLEEQEIYHVSKIRGAQLAFKIPVWKLKKYYDLPWMKEYSTPWMDYVRSLDSTNEPDKKELDSYAGGLPMTNEMISQLVCLSGAIDAWKAKLYADSIKPSISNQPILLPQQQNEQPGFWSNLFGSIFGRNKDTGANDYRRR